MLTPVLTPVLTPLPTATLTSAASADPANSKLSHVTRRELVAPIIIDCGLG